MRSMMVRLKEWRERRGLSLRKLAMLAGVHYVSLVRIEAGRLDPRLSTLLKLCEALHINLVQLVGRPQRRKGGRQDGTHETEG
jgi:transcriptional regulator with XRE-family HTH domain